MMMMDGLVRTIVPAHLWRDRHFVLSAVAGYGGLLRYVSKELRTDRDVIHLATNIGPHGIFSTNTW